jgi:hypothetical protein
MLTKYELTTIVAAALLSWPMISEAQKPQTLGGKNQQTIVETTPGKFRRGWIVKTDTTQRTFVDVSGERIDLPQNVVLYKIPTLEKEFAKMQRDVRAKEQDRTAEYAQLMDWARQRQLFESVDQLAEKILKRNPANPNAEAQIAQKWAREQLAVMKKTMSTGVDTGEFSMDDVQKIRFALLDPKAFGDANPQIAFKNNVLKRFIEDMNETGQYQTREEQREFFKLSSLEQALIIKKTTGNKYQPDITIGRDPQLMLDFKATVQPILSRSCAQPACHGGNATKLMLTAKTSSLPQIYYNYYTIDTFRTAMAISSIMPVRRSILC